MKVFQRRKLWYHNTMIKDEDSNLRKIERQLYTTDIQPPSKRSLLHGRAVDAPQSWNDSTTARSEELPILKKKNPVSMFRNVFLGSLVFLVIAVIVLGVSFIGGGNSISAKNVDIIITTKSFVDGGENLPVDISIVNRNKLPLELATLVLEYPQGTDDNQNAITRIERPFNTLGSGDTRKESFILQLYGQQNSQKTLTARVEFHVPGSNAVYNRDEPVTVTIRTSPVNLTLNAPASATPNQDIPLVFSIVGNGTASLTDTALVVQYPEGFTFTSADPKPSFGTAVWYLGDLTPGANRIITVHGTLAGGANDLKTVRASVGSQNKKDEKLLDTTYSSLTQVIPLANAFLAAHITVNGQATGTIPVEARQRVSIQVPWQNTLAVPVTNAQITVHVSGNGYDPATIQAPQGFFDSTNNQITWTSQDHPELATILPGASGRVTFSLTPKQFTGANILTNQNIILTVDVSGYQSGGTKVVAASVDTKTLVVGSDLNLLANSSHYTGSIQNSGPMPPTPGKETTYTIEWKIINLRNRVANVVVTTKLPTYVAWKNVALPSSEGANLTYNSVTRQVTWNVGDVPAGTGGLLPGKTVSFKVGITPSSSQLQTQPMITGQIDISGHDTFTDQDTSFSKRELYTTVLNDGTGPGTDGMITAN